MGQHQPSGWAQQRGAGARIGELPVGAGGYVGQHLDGPVDRNAGWKPEYFVPLFVMDAAKYRAFGAFATRVCEETASTS
jgi:hypothetical protein